jgi:transcriptional regulator with XRE-family HTH domain
MLFTRKKIEEGEETAAFLLRRTREEKKMTLESVSQKTGIKTAYLSALENGNYHQLPGGIYKKTFLKKYATYLGLKLPNPDKNSSGKKILADKEKNNVFSKKKISIRELLVFPKILRNVLIVIFFSALLFYLGFYLKNSFSLPKMEIFQPPDNFTTTDNFVEISGLAEARTQITINGEPVLKDETGKFQKRIELKTGINDVEISAQNKYSRKLIVKKQILVK